MPSPLDPWQTVRVSTLAQYLEQTGETASAFARRAGVSRGLVCAVAQGRPVGEAGVARRIVDATKGAVTLEDLARAPEETAVGRWLRETGEDPAALAARAGVSLQTVQDMRRGLRLKNLAAASRLREAMGDQVDLDDLVCRAA